MNTAIATRQFDQEQIDIMRRTVAKDLSREEFAFFMQVCKHRGLNPFNREIYAISRQGKVSYQVSIDGLRLLAERSGKYRGQLGPFWCGEDGEWREVWLSKTPPAAAKVGVVRADFSEPVWAVARYESYAQNSPTWQKMGDVMLAKCAESLALRRAFPAEMAGLYSHQEMEQAGVFVEAVAPNSDKIEGIYQSGKDKGMWATRSEMLPAVSAILGQPITRDNIYDLTDDLLAIVAQAIGQAPAA